MNDEYIRGYRDGFLAALSVKNYHTINIFGMAADKVLDILAKHIKNIKVIDVVDSEPVIIKRHGKIILEE